jgi:hypothetical protein
MVPPHRSREITLPKLTHLLLATLPQNGYTQFSNRAFSRIESHSVIRTLKRALLPCAFVVSTFLATSLADAEPQTNQPNASSSVNIELNKLEAADKGCRAYVVINNTTDTAYQSFKIDLVLFQSDGVIGKRFSIDLAPLRPKKKSVKLFDIDGMSCDKIGSMLINDVMECKSASGPVDGCLQHLTTSSLTKVQLSK